MAVGNAVLSERDPRRDPRGRIVVSLGRKCLGASPRSQTVLPLCCSEAFSIRRLGRVNTISI